MVARALGQREFSLAARHTVTVSSCRSGGKYVATVAVVTALGSSMPAHAQSTLHAQVTMENKTDQIFDLWVNGQYGCRALAGLDCTAQIPIGPQLWEARNNGQTKQSKDVGDVLPGASLVWTVCYVVPDGSRCR